MMLAPALMIILGTNTMLANAQGCNLAINSYANKNLDREQWDRINGTAERCKSRPSILTYFRRDEYQAGGVSLRELNEYIQPLNPSTYSIMFAMIEIVEADGLSVDFDVPKFKYDYDVHLSFSAFDLKILNRDGSEQKDCFSKFPVFSHSIRTIITLVFNKAIKYHDYTCPTIFANSIIDEIKLFEVIESVVKHNMLAFRPTNQTLNTTIEYVTLSGYWISFNTKMFPTVLFSKVKRIILDGVVATFERQTLRSSSVTRIILSTLRLRRFFHNNPDWLNDANLRGVRETLVIALNFRQPIITKMSEFFEFIKSVEALEAEPFDDASFCIFLQIELYSLNVKIDGYPYKIREPRNCTCLLLWLIKKAWWGNEQNLCNLDRANLSRQCQFDKMAQRCSIDKIEPMSYLTTFDTIFGIEFVKYLADVWLTPVSSVLGVIANFLVIRTFRKIKNSPEYRRNKLTDKGRFMWVYTYYNSWFVLFHSLIFTLMPLTSCIEYNGIYCPRIAVSKFSQAYYLFAQSFFGNTMRLMANMSQTLFVLFRFGLNTDRLSRFRKIRPGKVLSFLSIPAAILSLVTLFLNERFKINILFQDSNYILYYRFKIRFALGLQVVYLLNIILGTTLFTMFNMLVDLRLLSLLRKQNAQRRKEEVENRITKMVILNGLFSFLFRTPEMICTILLVMHLLDLQFLSMCITNQSHLNSVCPMLFDISRFLLTLSFLENLVLLYLFNPNFKKHFSNQKIESKK
nr:G protein-coupled receptor [Proales similis]